MEFLKELFYQFTHPSLEEIIDASRAPILAMLTLYFLGDIDRDKHDRDQK